MLGIIGFVTLAIVIAVFCFVLWNTQRKTFRDTVSLRSIVLGFSLLAVSCLVWAGAVALANHTQALVFTTDVLLLLATGLIMQSMGIFNRYPWLIVVACIAAAALLTVRAFVVPSTAFVDEGLLHFNLTQIQALVIGLPFLVIWLPAGARFFNRAFAGAQYAMIRQLTIFAYCATVLVTCYFLAATRPIIIIATFISIGILFVAMTVSVQAHAALRGHAGKVK